MKYLLILCLAVSISFASFSQTSREHIYTLASGAGNYDYDQLTDFVDSQLTDKEDIALFFYYWLALHIEYDDEVTLYDIGYSKSAAESIQNQSVLKSRKTTCMGFTNLYNSFLEHFGIEHRLVIGYSKNSSNILKGIEPQIDHAWSAIRLNGQWHLVEPTWANQLIEDPKTRDYYFKTDPAEMILQHLPKDEKWQLMDEKWNFNRFAQAPLVDPWYIARTKLINHELTVEKNKNGELVITCTKISRWKLLLKAVNDKNQDLMNLKYRVSSNGKTIQFTLKKYDGKSAIRLDARRTGVNNMEFKAPGLAYLTHIGLN